MIAAVQAILNDSYKVCDDMEYYRKLISNEAALIEAKAEQLAESQMTARELEAVRKSHELAQQFENLCNYIQNKTGMSISEIFSELKDNESPVKSITEKKTERKVIEYGKHEFDK